MRDDSDRPHYLVRDLEDLGDEFDEVRTFATDVTDAPETHGAPRVEESDCTGVYVDPGAAAPAYGMPGQPETWPQTRVGRRTGAPRAQQIEHRRLPDRARVRIRCIVVEFTDGRRMVLK